MFIDFLKLDYADGYSFSFFQLSRVVQNNSSSLPPEERYRSQLEQLTAMGFLNHEANIQGKFFEIIEYGNLNSWIFNEILKKLR